MSVKPTSRQTSAVCSSGPGLLFNFTFFFLPRIQSPQSEIQVPESNAKRPIPIHLSCAGDHRTRGTSQWALQGYIFSIGASGCSSTGQIHASFVRLERIAIVGPDPSSLPDVMGPSAIPPLPMNRPLPRSSTGCSSRRTASS